MDAVLKQEEVQLVDWEEVIGDVGRNPRPEPLLLVVATAQARVEVQLLKAG